MSNTDTKFISLFDVSFGDPSPIDILSADQATPRLVDAITDAQSAIHQGLHGVAILCLERAMFALKAINRQNPFREGGWRYQPVCRDDPGGQVITLCEVYLDADGRLEGWTENPAITPQGGTIADLIGDLFYMQMDATEWVPVSFDALSSGMHLERVSE